MPPLSNGERISIDTLDFCQTVGITKDFYIKRMDEIKSKISYSRYTPQLFMSQIPAEEFSVFREKLFRFKGFSVEKRSVRHYTTGLGAHLLGDVGEVNDKDIANDDYYQSGDFIGKLGVERSYEKELRGEKDFWRDAALLQSHERLRYLEGGARRVCTHDGAVET